MELQAEDVSRWRLHDTEEGRARLRLQRVWFDWRNDGELEFKEQLRAARDLADRTGHIRLFNPSGVMGGKRGIADPAMVVLLLETCGLRVVPRGAGPEWAYYDPFEDLMVVMFGEWDSVLYAPARVRKDP